MSKEIILWSDKFSVGVKELDDQHKKLIHLLNNIYIKISDNEVKNDYLSDVFIDILDYTKYHFKTEEIYFKKFGYYDKEHIQEHTYLREKIIQLYKQSSERKPVISIKLLEFLLNWVQNHILVSDKKYRKIFNDNGLY